MANLEDMPMWGPKEVAHYFRIHLNTVSIMARIPLEKGGPPVCRFGRIVRFPVKEFLEWARAAKPFRSINPKRKRKKNVLGNNRVRRVTRTMDASV